MLRLLESLHLSPLFFSANDFEVALSDLESILKTVAATTNDPSCKEKNIPLLNKAFNLSSICLNATKNQQPDKRLSFLIADIFRHYATLLFDSNCFIAKQILLISLNLQLYSIGITDNCFNLRDFQSFNDLEKFCQTNSSYFFEIERSILTTNIDCCMTLAYRHHFMQSSSKTGLFSLAETTRWLGYTYQMLDETCCISKENDLRFSQLFGLSESLLLLLPDEESKLALADLYFQAWPFMHARKNPHDAEVICQLYEKALYCDPSTEMQARVAHQRFLTLFARDKKTKALPYIQQATTLALKLENSDRKSFLLSCLYDSYASYWMDPKTLNLEEAESNLAKACYHAILCRENGNDHSQYAIFDTRMAELKFVLGEFKIAKMCVERALKTLNLQPQCQREHLIKAEALKSLIDKVLKYT